ncbi:MAG: PilZ domain-containing protein [Alphaproteobacteria bacterium]
MRAHNDNFDTERRFCERTLRFKKVRIILHDGGVFDGIMRNMSRTGAQLDMVNTKFLPKSFKVRVVNDDVVHTCKLVWRKYGAVGVVFTG